jgi:hypothetical protein
MMILLELTPRSEPAIQIIVRARKSFAISSTHNKDAEWATGLIFSSCMCVRMRNGGVVVYIALLFSEDATHLIANVDIAILRSNHIRAFLRGFRLSIVHLELWRHGLVGAPKAHMNGQPGAYVFIAWEQGCHHQPLQYRAFARAFLSNHNNIGDLPPVQRLGQQLAQPIEQREHGAKLRQRLWGESRIEGRGTVAARWVLSVPHVPVLLD